MALPTDRRIQLLLIDPGSFMALFKEGLKAREDYQIIKGLPEDAQLLAVTYEFKMHAVLLVVWSSRFKNIPPGQELPYVPVEIKTGRQSPSGGERAGERTPSSAE